MKKTDKPKKYKSVFKKTEAYHHQWLSNCFEQPTSIAEIIKRSTALLIEAKWEWEDISYFQNKVFGESFGITYGVLLAESKKSK